MADAKTEEMSSSAARDEILSQHARLRDLLSRAGALAERASQSTGGLDALRGAAQDLYDALAAHVTFEDEVLPAALRDVIGWGDVIHHKMEEDHLRQRQELALAISTIGPNGLSGAALIENVRAFARTLAIDMESEERGLLQADLDAIASDSRGG
jgi:hemerythrin HHE cation binding domain-containing protein